MAFFNNQPGNQIFTGTEAEYDQVDYAGALSEYIFTFNANETVTAAHPTLGTDTLISIEGFWFSGEQVWYSVEDAVRLTSGGEIPSDPDTITGTAGADVLMGTGDNDVFYGGMGDDYIHGLGGTNDVANFDGALIEYTVGRRSGDTFLSHPTWGEDTLRDVENVFFMREGVEYTVQEALNLTRGLPRFRIDADTVINGTPNRDIMNGTDADEAFYGGAGNDILNGRLGFDQVNYDGALADYTVTQIPNGYVFEHPVWGIDILRSIEGLYFAGEGVWYPVVAATFGF